MIQMLYILFGMVIILFVLAIILTVLPDKKKKEDKTDKPIDKTPVKIELQIQYDGYLFTLYSDYTWEVDTLY